MLSQCWGNIVKLHNFRCCHNFMRMLPECCGLTKVPCSHSVVPTLRNRIIFNVATVWLQSCRNTPRIRNFVSPFWKYVVLAQKCLEMLTFQCRDDYCKCAENSNLNVTVILDLRPASTMFGTNVGSIFTQCCLCIVATTAPNIEEGRCHNIHVTLLECCLIVGPQHLGWKLPQHSHNIAWMLSHFQPSLLGSVFATTFTQCWDFGWNTTFTQRCLDINTMLLGRLKVSSNNHSYNNGANVPTSTLKN